MKRLFSFTLLVMMVWFPSATGVLAQQDAAEADPSEQRESVDDDPVEIPVRQIRFEQLEEPFFQPLRGLISVFGGGQF